MDTWEPPVLRAGGCASERLEQRSFGALRLLGGQSRPELRPKQDSGSNAGGGGTSDRGVGQVPVGDKVPPQAASGDLASGNAMRQLALELQSPWWLLCACVGFYLESS